jgi:ribosomal protein L32
MNPRRTGGRETWHRLRDWDKGQSESERLAARLLSIEGYEDIDPSHPLGGPDGGKDVLCKKDGRSCVVAVYFPRGQQEFRDTANKFDADLAKVKAQSAAGFVFFTNQELTLSERAKLEDSADSIVADIYHLERIASCLDTPRGYGLRLEFLSIEMTKEEQVSFFNDRDQVLYEIRDNVASLIEKRSKAGHIKTVYVEQPDRYSFSASIFGSKLVECKNCGEIFRAERSPFSSFAMTGSLETVKCPNCGKLQAFHG